MLFDMGSLVQLYQQFQSAKVCRFVVDLDGEAAVAAAIAAIAKTSSTVTMSR